MEQLTILIVDDNPVNMKLVRVLLTGDGYQVRTAADAHEALRILKECHPKYAPLPTPTRPCVFSRSAIRN